MNIPFLSLFQKARDRFRPSAPVSPVVVRAVPVEKPSSEKLSKTVLPNSTRTMTSRDLIDVTANSAAARSSVGSTTRNTAGTSRGLPPAVALALEPKVERTISVQLSDILSEIPSGYAKPAESLEPSRRILLKASEIEKGMATGKPTVSLAAVYEQIPEIFLRSVPSTELMHLPLPYDKVLEQFSSARVRGDQERDHTVPQVETPILQVTLEDTKRFGTTMEPLQTSSLPPIKVEMASASSLAAAEPENAVREVVPPPRARSTIPLSVAMPSTPEPSPVKSAPPTRIPFKLPPNGTGESASERVPASSGPPVPTRPPARNPFKISPPSDALRPRKTLVPGTERTQSAEDPATACKQSPADDIKIAIPLLPILQTIPPFQLNGDVSIVPPDARIEFPFALIQPQLVTGRLAIAPRVFQAAMPVNFRELLIVDPSETPILLPLQEVLKNIPDAALQVRPDQEQIETGEIIETPFSIKAREDAERFKTEAKPMPKATEPLPAEVEATVPNDKIDNEKIDIKKVESPAEAAPVEKKLDAKEVVARARALEGVTGCSVTFADGLILAGNFPDEFAVEGLCAVAPSLLQRIEKHMVDSKLGGLTAMTLHGDKAALSFFLSGNICLTALHAVAELAVETQSQLSEMVKELSQTYAQPEPTNVDH